MIKTIYIFCCFPKFKNSKFAKQSFNWNNQGYKILETDNPKFKIFRLMKMSLKMRYHRELPDDYKLNQITVVRHNNKYYIALSITYNKNIHQKLIEDIQLDKSILNTSFYQFSSQLEYKAKHNGKLFVKIEPKNTSKTCHVCGSIKDNLTLKDRQYLCEYCGTVIHRDINASLNILNLGYKSFGLGISLEDYKLKPFVLADSGQL